MRVVASQRTRHSWQWRATLGSLAVLGAALLMWLVVIPALRAEAADFTVTAFSDTSDLNDDGSGGGIAGDGIVNGTETPDGNCDAGGGQCTLRAALFEAHGSGADDTIALPASGTITLASNVTIWDTGLTINGNDREISAGGIATAISIAADRVTLNSMVIDGEGTGGTGVLIPGGTDDTILDSLTVRDFTTAGISAPSGDLRTTIRNSTITSNDGDGIILGSVPGPAAGTDTHILGNTITDNGLAAGGNGIEIPDFSFGENRLLIQGNNLSGNFDSQIYVGAMLAGSDIDIFQNTITSNSNGIWVDSITGGDIDIGLLPDNRNVFRGTLGVGEYHLVNISGVNIDAEHNDWNNYDVAGVEGVICHDADVDPNCPAGTGPGVVDFEPFIATPSPLPTPTPTLGPATATPTVTPTVEGTPPSGATEDLPLALGCNFEASTYPDATAPATLAGAVIPAANLAGLWAQQPAPLWRGYNPLFPEVSDMGPVDRLDVLAICMIGTGTFTRPII